MTKHCQTCKQEKPSNENKLKKCSKCKSAFYCSIDCQKKDWNIHKKVCLKYKNDASDKDTHVAVIEIQAGEGNGLGNKMKNHFFNTKEEALEYIEKELHCGQLKPFKQMEFLTDILKFKHAELFVVPKYEENQSNDLLSSCATIIQSVLPNGDPIPKNGMAIYLACGLITGLSFIPNTRGPAFFIGRNERNECVTANVLWGVANFIWDAMDYYGEEEFWKEGYGAIRPVFEKWGQKYISQTWEPQGGYGGVNVYQTDVTKLGDRWKSFWNTIDHRN